MRRIAALGLIVVLATPWMLEADTIRQRTRQRCCQTAAAIALATLDEAEITDLMFIREEEKLAHDLYMSFFDAWGIQVFEKITAAESKHMAAVLRALKRYDLDDPAAGNAIGVFTDPDIGQLYGDLFLSGSLSIVEALKAAALVEERDIVDLRGAIATTDNEDLDKMYGNLLRGSSNHLRAYDQHLVKRGVDYEPQFLTQEEYDAIVTAGRR